MFSDLRANPEVLWGALIAFGIVVLLTPAVGGMARLLGVVDQPNARRLNKRPIPRLGGLAIFFGILVPSLAFLDLERFEEVARLLEQSGLPFARRSRIIEPLSEMPAVVLLDSIGELGAAWGLADVGFTGGSLDGRRGGQSMIEPAGYGATLLFGPNTWNFKDVVDLLLGDPAKALAKLGWRHRTSFRELVAEMVESDRLVIKNMGANHAYEPKLYAAQ
jgi:hypothetical protein